VKRRRLVAAVTLLLLASAGAPAADEAAFERRDRSVQLVVRGETVATCVHDDPAVRRPFFANVKAPGGAAVTRPHPPIDADGPADHADMHPGIWLAFGDLAGADFWRNKGVVEQERLEVDQRRPDTLRVENRYVSGGRIVCRESARYTVVVRPGGYLIAFDSTFRPEDADFAFGDQEEMGLGVRVAAPLAVKFGGRLFDSVGRKKEAAVWGRQAEWCAADGEVRERRVGVVVMPDPGNFRPGWFHARDYGLVVANPFGRKAFTRGEESRVVVRKGESLRLRFGVAVYAVDKSAEPDVRGHYDAYLKFLRAGDPAQ
jgi:hypothetical protein